MGPIICATDCFKNSISALELGYALSRKLETQLIVLHVFDINVALVTPLSLTFAKIEKEAFEKHQEKLSNFCEQHLGVLPEDKHLKILVKENAILEEELIQNIHDFNARFIIMGMKGKSAIKDVIVGSTTKSMMIKGPCPVMAVPSILEGFEMDTITYATDFEESDIHALDWIVNTLAKPFQSQINIVHIATKEERNGEDQMEWFKEMLQQKVVYNKMSFDFIEHENVFDGLNNYLKKVNSNLIVMLEREHGGLIKSLTHIDRVKLMASKGKIPLISFNKKFLK